MQVKPFRRFKVKAPTQNRLQSMAHKIATAKDKIAKANADLTEATQQFYNMCDNEFGEETYVIYEARGPHAGNRLARQMGESRRIDDAMLRDMLPPHQWEACLRDVPPVPASRVFDAKLFDALMEAHEIDDSIASQAVSFHYSPSLIWGKTTANTQYPLKAGEVAIVGGTSVEQEG